MIRISSHLDGLTMARTKLLGWQILSMLRVEDNGLTNVNDRHEWLIIRHWVCKDMPPDITMYGEAAGSFAWMNHRVLAL